MVDQYKTNHLTNSLLNSNMTYTEPITKDFSLVLSYNMSLNNSNADRKSFNKAADGSYSLLDSTYSNNYKLKQVTNQAGAIFSYRKGKTLVNFGTRAADVDFKQVDEYTGDVFKRTFINWNPQALYQYRFAQQATFTINYNGRTTQPTVDQIQPVLVNTDPLNVVIGNPGLTPSFTNNFNIGYNSYKILSDQSIYVGGSYSFTSNPIVTSMVIDSVGKSVSQYINLNRLPYNFSLYANYRRKISTLGTFGINLNSSGSKTYNLSNGEVNAITSNTYNTQVSISKYEEKKYNFYLSFGPTFIYGGSSLQRNINNNGRGSTGDGSFQVFFPWRLSITSDLNYQYNSKTETFNQDYSRLIMNAWIVKAFDKSENFKITLICNDVFNQNSGFSRTSSGNLITQENYTTIKRFFMITLLWDFSKMGGSVKK